MIKKGLFGLLVGLTGVVLSSGKEYNKRKEPISPECKNPLVTKKMKAETSMAQFILLKGSVLRSCEKLTKFLHHRAKGHYHRLRYTYKELSRSWVLHSLQKKLLSPGINKITSSRNHNR